MPKILIVEDDLQLSEMYEAKLKHDGFEVIVSHDGKSGLQNAQTMSPDAIILDIMLIDQKYSGLSMLEDLRKDEKGKNIPVLALTNLTQKELTQKAVALGVKEYLIKAMHTPEEVVQKVKELLGSTSVLPSSSPLQE